MINHFHFFATNVFFLSHYCTNEYLDYGLVLSICCVIVVINCCKPESVSCPHKRHKVIDYSSWKNPKPLGKRVYQIRPCQRQTFSCFVVSQNTKHACFKILKCTKNIVSKANFYFRKIFIPTWVLFKYTITITECRPLIQIE